MIPDRSDKKAFAEYAAGVMLAFAEGKKVQSSLIGCNKWALNLEPTWLWDRLDYRIAPESPAVEPWTFETAPTEARVRRKSDGKLAAVGFYPNEAVIYFGPEDWSSISYLELRDEFEQLDGSPCGVVASDWPKWFTVAKDENQVWKMTDEREGEYYHKGKYYDESAFSVAELLADKNIKQITAAEAGALIQKARTK